MRRIVVSHGERGDAAGPRSNTSVLSGDVADEVRRLKDQPGGDILVHGSDGVAIMIYRPALGTDGSLTPPPLVSSSSAQ